MVNIKDVARRAGVSTATVSRYMNQREIVSPRAQRRVAEAIAELRYEPNPMARALQTQKSGIIGLVVPVVDYAFFSRLTDAVERACSRSGYKLMLCQSAYSDTKELEMVSLLKANKVDGILLCSRLGDASLYTESDFPIISIDRELEGVPSVMADNFGGGVLAADALYRAGSRHVLVLTTEVPEYMAMYQRQNGFRAECASRGMEYVECILNDVNFGTEETERILAQMEQHPEIDGVFALGDLIAAGFLHMLLQQPDSQRRRLPLVGFDGLDVSRLFEFSTVAQPIQKMGQLAVELLISRINGNPVPERSALPVEYIERKSTTSIRAPRASDTAR
ncbi:MAG: LacI family DNA-binding transcriptional regulator [Christensenella sp.]|nr:LacI family DNA-binding transcriptional regulator [Christensenella sp.]